MLRMDYIATVMEIVFYYLQEAILSLTPRQNSLLFSIEALFFY